MFRRRNTAGIRGRMRSRWICNPADKFVETALRGAIAVAIIALAAACHAASSDDGPHVFWQNDSTAIVLYVCNDSVITQTYHAHDTIRFNGWCADSTETYAIPVSAPESDTQTVFSKVSRVFAVSDIHGSYEPFRDLLRVGGVIDSEGHWSWGDGHLVIDGDVFDRGPNATECLWLIYRLEREAWESGGAVHFLLGNHELMVLRGDLRYVNERYTDGICKRARIHYNDLYGPQSEIGRWLRTKPTGMVINGVLYVHGGISTTLIDRQFSLAQLNSDVRAGLDLNSAQLAFDSTARFLFGSLGPLWYRGYHYGIEGRYDSATIPQIDSVLAYYGANEAVVGHSEVEGGIGVLDSGRVIAIDVDLEELGNFEGLLCEGNRYWRVTGAGERIDLDLRR